MTVLRWADDTYSILLDDLRAIRVERHKRASEEAIIAHWEIGQRIASDPNWEDRVASVGKVRWLEQLSEDLDWSASTLHRSVSFYEQYPHLQLDQGPEGLLQLCPDAGMLTWRRICDELLPGEKRERKPTKKENVLSYSHARVGQVWSAADHRGLEGML